MFYQTVADHRLAFRARMEEAGGLPKFVVGEFALGDRRKEEVAAAPRAAEGVDVAPPERPA